MKAKGRFKVIKNYTFKSVNGDFKLAKGEEYEVDTTVNTGRVYVKYTDRLALPILEEDFKKHFKKVKN